MIGLEFSPAMQQRLKTAGAAYPDEAFLFLLAVIERLQSRMEIRRHLSAREVAQGWRDLAINRFGPMALVVQEFWGIRCTGDIGRLVYTLVEVGLLVTQPGDSEEDFAHCYDFTKAFSTACVWQGQTLN